MTRAFSLIEIVITLVIIGIVAAIAAPRLASSSVSNRLDAAEHRMCGAFERVGELARSRGSTMAIMISLDKDAMFVFEGTTVARETLVAAVDFGDEPYRIDLVSSTISDPEGIVLVDAFGVYESAAKVNVTADGIPRAIQLSGPVGPIAATADAGSWDDDDADEVLNINVLGILKIKL